MSFIDSHLGRSLVLDFAVTHVQQQKYTDTVRDANWVTAGSFAEQYATVNKSMQRAEATAAHFKFGAMVVESYGSWCPSAMSVLREVAVARAAKSGSDISKGAALHQILTALNVTLMRSQARMLVLRLPANGPRPGSPGVREGRVASGQEVENLVGKGGAVSVVAALLGSWFCRGVVAASDGPAGNKVRGSERGGRLRFARFGFAWA